MKRVIAVAILNFLTSYLQSSKAARQFCRLDGFDDEVCQILLSLLQDSNSPLAGKPLWVRTTGLVQGYENYALDSDKSATWYRNHTPPNHFLLLIFNRNVSDAQSLKDIYQINERVLATKALDCLIDAAFVDYTLTEERVGVIKSFLDRFKKVVAQPQLRNTVDFLCALNSYLSQSPDVSVKSAIANSLPYLGLFRCGELASVLDTPKGDQLLRNVHRAARLGAELLDEKELESYRDRVQQAEFDDDSSYGGDSSEIKRQRLQKFLTEVLIDRTELLKVLQLDWREVEPILFKKGRKNKKEKLQELAETLQTALEEQQFEQETLSEEVKDTLHNLTEGTEPDSEDLETVLTDYGDNLPKNLKNQLRKLRGTRKYQTDDFIVGVAYLATDLLLPLQKEITEDTVLKVEFDGHQLEEVGNEEAEALLAFLVLYGGIESFMPTIQWELASLWNLAQQQANYLQTNTEDTEDDAKKRKVDLLFRVSVLDSEGHEVGHADLTWHYRPDSPATATLAHVLAEARLLSQQAVDRLPIPIYNTCSSIDDLGDLDLSRPVQSVGAWYFNPTNLGEVLKNTLDSRVSPESWSVLEARLIQLEEAWSALIRTSSSHGILAANLGSLLSAYELLLQEFISRIENSQQATYTFRVLAQAWVVGPESFDDWVIVPFFHPLKLLWWRERTREFSTFIAELLNPTSEAIVVDERRFRQEMSITYSSAGYPAVLALLRGNGRPDYFLPVHEVSGYELFRWIGQAGIAYGLNPDLVAEDESELAAKIASQELANVVRDYVETHPFIQDGLEIYLLQCRNSSLPSLLVENLETIARRKDWKLNINVVVHSTDRGASLYQRVTRWLENHDEFSARSSDAYFPPITLKVLECASEELLEKANNADIVILPDVLAEKGQAVAVELQDSQDEAVPLEGYLPTYPSQQAPFEQGELTRDILLTSVPEPLLLQNFYKVQWAVKERKPIPPEITAKFRLQVSLQDWEMELMAMHEHFNWVVCYDTTVDRFLLKTTLPETVEVIRYSLGLGAKRRHNLTVSSSYRAQDVVIRRLTNNLESLLPSTPYDFRHQVAQNLVIAAKEISGNIVLRAAGPGAYLNELIGLVVAKQLTERKYLQSNPNSMIAWIYLDDFAHWFERKLPDLLFVAIPPQEEGELSIHLEILESKCVGERSFAIEAKDAQQQVAQGINRLAQAWAPGKTHLDAPYWYDQFYKAVVGNLAVSREQIPLWEAFRQRVPRGSFSLNVSGHTWAFCHDGSAGLQGYQKEEQATVKASNFPDIPHQCHYFGRAGLRRVLQELVEGWGIQSPNDTWSSKYDISEVKLLTSEMASTQQLELLPKNEIASTPDQETLSTSAASTTEAELTSGTPLETFETLSTSEDDSLSVWLLGKANELMRACSNYDIKVYPIETKQADVGPSIVRYKVRLKPGEKLSRLQAVAEDLARELALESIPLIANIPGSNYVGIDLPRSQAETIYLLPLLEKLQRPKPGELPIIIGQTPEGQTVVEDMSEFPHLLVAGATNSGKSVFLRSLVLCLITQYSSSQLRLLIVDPKRTDFSFFNNLPYLIGNKVITDQQEARDMLLDLVHNEMIHRQEAMAGRSMRVKDFNVRYPNEALPLIVAIIDEYAQLVSIMTKRERDSFERDLMSLAAVARSTGIHLILATQRPSADVVTGTLKANLPASIAFKVASAVNSRIVIDQNGAENLLGRGDMLFQRPSGELIRLQAPFMDEVTLQEYLRNFTKRSS